MMQGLSIWIRLSLNANLNKSIAYLSRFNGSLWMLSVLNLVQISKIEFRYKCMLIWMLNLLNELVKTTFLYAGVILRLCSKTRGTLSCPDLYAWYLNIRFKFWAWTTNLNWNPTLNLNACKSYESSCKFHVTAFKIWKCFQI